jgi:hypothetical protein
LGRLAVLLILPDQVVCGVVWVGGVTSLGASLMLLRTGVGVVWIGLRVLAVCLLLNISLMSTLVEVVRLELQVCAAVVAVVGAPCEVAIAHLAAGCWFGYATFSLLRVLSKWVCVAAVQRVRCRDTALVDFVTDTVSKLSKMLGCRLGRGRGCGGGPLLGAGPVTGARSILLDLSSHIARAWFLSDDL